jgi:hypothetical protein
LGGEIERFDVDRVYVPKYQAWFKPSLIVDEYAAEGIITKLTKLESDHRSAKKQLEESFEKKIKEIIPDVFKR